MTDYLLFVLQKRNPPTIACSFDKFYPMKSLSKLLICLLSFYYQGSFTGSLLLRLCSFASFSNSQFHLSFFLDRRFIVWLQIDPCTSSAWRGVNFFIVAFVVLCLGFVTETVCWVLLSSAWFAVFSLFSNSFGVWFVHLFFFPKISLFECTFFGFFSLAYVCPFLSPILLGKSELDGGLGAVWGQPISPFFRHQV